METFAPGRNVEVTVNGKEMTIKVDLSKRFGRSASGKTEILATTKGNVDVPGHPGMKVGLNVYTK